KKRLGLIFKFDLVSRKFPDLETPSLFDAVGEIDSILGIADDEVSQTLLFDRSDPGGILQYVFYGKIRRYVRDAIDLHSYLARYSFDIFGDLLKHDRGELFRDDLQSLCCSILGVVCKGFRFFGACSENYHFSGRLFGHKTIGETDGNILEGHLYAIPYIFTLSGRDGIFGFADQKEIGEKFVHHAAQRHEISALHGFVKDGSITCGSRSNIDYRVPLFRKLADEGLRKNIGFIMDVPVFQMSHLARL